MSLQGFHHKAPTPTLRGVLLSGRKPGGRRVLMASIRLGWTLMIEKSVLPEDA